MNAKYQEFRQLLNTSIKQILWLYFATPVAGQTEEVLRERLFCYELYHQLRCVCDKANFDYWIGGELDKTGHPLIRGDLKPDFVVHEPGDMERNLCVLEVKRVTGDEAGFKKDIATLLTFVTQYSYHAGLLLVFGDTENAELIIKSKIGADLNALRQKNIFVIWARRAQSDVVELQ